MPTFGYCRSTELDREKEISREPIQVLGVSPDASQDVV